MTSRGEGAELGAPRAPYVERVAAWARERGDTPAIFPADHPLARLERASWSRTCEALARYDLNLSFNYASEADDDPRGGYRPNYAALFGPGMDLIMPTAAAYMCRPGRNRVFVPEATDPTIVAYLQQVGFLGDVVYRTGLDGILDELRRTERRLYSIDDLGSEAADPWAANCHRDTVVLNSKEEVTRISSYAAPEVQKDMFEVEDADFLALWEPGRRIYLKTCNTEAAGAGIFPVDDLDGFRRDLETIREHTRRWNLSPVLVLQPALSGDNKSFQVFLEPDPTERIPVVALTDQLVGPDSRKYAGSINHPTTAGRLEVVGAAIVDLVDRIREHCPGAIGFLMCDYFEGEDGSVTIYDPGLRPSSNTAAALVRMWLEEATGSTASVVNSPWFDFGEPGIPYAEVVTRLGEYADPDRLLDRRLGVLPRGHNHIQGKTRFIIVTPTREEYPDFRRELEERIIG